MTAFVQRCSRLAYSTNVVVVPVTKDHQSNLRRHDTHHFEILEGSHRTGPCEG